MGKTERLVDSCVLAHYIIGPVSDIPTVLRARYYPHIGNILLTESVEIPLTLCDDKCFPGFDIGTKYFLSILAGKPFTLVLCSPDRRCPDHSELPCSASTSHLEWWSRVGNGISRATTDTFLLPLCMDHMIWITIEENRLLMVYTSNNARIVDAPEHKIIYGGDFHPNKRSIV